MDIFVYNRIKKFKENIAKSVSGSEIGLTRGYPVGTVRVWNGKKYKKRINKEWEYVGNSDKKSKTDKESSDKELTSEESQAIIDYTEIEYGEINKYLRGKIQDRGYNEKQINKIKDKVEHIRSALDKLDGYDGGVVYRTVTQKGTFEGVKEKYQNVKEEGKILEYDGFLSTSASREVAADFGRTNDSSDIRVFFSIMAARENSAGTDISKHSSLRTEEEVLFKDKARFEVMDVVETTQGDPPMQFVEVQMKEV